MDLDTAADELYGLDPDEFVPARTALVAQARAAKDRPLATAIGALKKPTRSAWLVNLLSREDASAVAELSDVAGRVAAAHQAADLTALRMVGGERQRLVDVLTRRAAALAGERGQVVTDAVRLEVHGTLAAAVADADVLDEVRRGRVVKARVYSGFGFPLGMMPEGASAVGEAAVVQEGPVEVAAVEVVPVEATSGEAAAGEAAAGEAASGEAASGEAAAGEAAAAVRDRAERALREAQLAAAKTTLAEARARLERTEDSEHQAGLALDRASHEVADLRAELRAAEQAEEQARSAATRAADDVHDARAAVQQAEQALAAADRP